MGSSLLHHVCYENEIPDGIRRALADMYQSAFATSEYFELFRGASRFAVLAIFSDRPKPDHLLAYTVVGTEAVLLNELVTIEQEYLFHFAAYLFSRYPHVASVRINRLTQLPVQDTYSRRLWCTSQDIAVPLPKTFAEYHARLGHQTQKHIRYYLSRLQREQSGYEFRVFGARQIDTAAVSSIIALNRARMKGKNVSCGYDALYEANIKAFCRYRGLVGAITVDGRIAAGAICYETGNHLFLETIAHDSAFNRYNLGQVCLYLTIKQAIQAGMTSFHMLWGENEYKYRLLGVKQELYSFSLYRSQWARLFDTPRLMRHICRRIFAQADYLVRKYLIRRFRR